MVIMTILLLSSSRDWRICSLFLYSKMSKVSFLDRFKDLCPFPSDKSDFLPNKANLQRLHDEKKGCWAVHLGQLYQLFLLKYCATRNNDPTWWKTDLQIYKAKRIIYKKPQSFYWNHWNWNENTMSVCFRHVSYSAECHPFPLGPKGQSVPNSLRSLFVILQTCKKEKKKKRHRVFGFVRKDCGENFHTFSSACINFQCCALPGVWEFELKCSDSVFTW